MKAMNQRGMTAYLFFKVYNKLANWPKNHSPEDDLFFRYVIARYAAYPNVIWNLAKEAQYEKSTRYKIDRLKFIRSTDGYHRLLTVHDDSLTRAFGTCRCRASATPTITPMAIGTSSDIRTILRDMDT